MVGILDALSIIHVVTKVRCSPSSFVAEESERMSGKHSKLPSLHTFCQVTLVHSV